MRYSILIILLCACTLLQAQKSYKYTAIQKRVLINANKDFLRLEQLTPQQAFNLGRVYETTYDRFKDTSMERAIICYTSSAYEEHPDGLTPFQRTVHDKLGSIYEKGKGIKADSLIAMSMNSYGSKTGLANLERLRKHFCKQPVFFSMPYTTERITDSTFLNTKLLKENLGMSIPLYGDCRLTAAQLEPVTRILAAHMLANPTINIKISNCYKSHGGFYMMDDQYKGVMHMNQLKDYLIEKEGISSSRITTDKTEDCMGQRIGLSIVNIEFVDTKK